MDSPKDRSTRNAQRLERIRRGVAEEVVAADGDDRNARTNGVDKRSTRRIRRAVMPRFQYVRVQIDYLGSAAALRITDIEGAIQRWDRDRVRCKPRSAGTTN